jgi:acyl carrier protein
METNLRHDIRAYLANELGRNVGPVGDSESLLEAGVIDSLGVLQLVASLESRYGVSVTDDEMLPENFETIAAIAAFVTAKRNGHHLD